MDKSKCSNTECINKLNCLRFTYVNTKVNQSYNNYIPKLNNIRHFKCDNFINNK